jgi:hypothetical protein
MKILPERLKFLSGSGVFLLSIPGMLALLLPIILAPVVCRADFQMPNFVTTSSVSGQFAVIAARQVSALAGSLAVKTNASLVHLEPALLAVSAENIKVSIDHQLGMDPSTWRGQIFLALHPAQSLDENVAILSTRFNDVWIYRVELPDVVSRARLTRALTEVILLEYANREAGDRSADVPAWLVDGLTWQLLGGVAPEIVTLPADDFINGYPENRLVRNDVAFDALVKTREVLKNSEPLTFEQLSWPTDAQLAGTDGGTYRASAQLFVVDLLGLHTGAADLCAMLQVLPQFYNWQLAFRAAFRADFPSPLDLEKWWALQTVDFVSRDGGLQWSPDVSRGKMDEILSVSIDYRTGSNSMPVRAEISLQALINNFDSARQAEILQEKVRDLDLAQLQMAPQFAVLNDQYRRALADYLDDNPQATASRWIKHPPSRIGSVKTIQRLDALDAQRRALENGLNDTSQPALTDAGPHL